MGYLVCLVCRDAGKISWIPDTNPRQKCKFCNTPFPGRSRGQGSGKYGRKGDKDGKGRSKGNDR
eukprot:3807065-Pyramimonas_sp.AAC.1